MSFDYSGKVVIITGSSSGIGQAAAILFAKSGASVTIHGRSEDGLKKTMHEILAAGGTQDKICSVRGAVTDEKVLKALIDETVKKFGKIDVLINNVGIANKEGLGVQNSRSMENLDYVLDVNLKSVIHLTELAIPHLEKTKGNIVSVSSIGSQKTNPGVPFYCIAKAALDHFARNYAAILAPKGIRINNLNPGGTSTAFMSRHGIPQEIIDKTLEHYYKNIPLGRFASSSEMAEFLLFIASDKASYMTGQCIIVDGGSLIDSPAIKFD
jgi:NAD(P)-dependent dehydrogenase (short-subunit alcohol dehydrogenase family)